MRGTPVGVAHKPTPDENADHCTLDQNGAGSRGMVVLGRAMSTMPPSAFQPTPLSASEPLVRSTAARQEIVLTADAPPPRLA